jgi:membrane-bound ClpP family serine protease
MDHPSLWTFLFLGLAFVVAVAEVFLPSAGIFAVLAIALLITSIVFAFQVGLVFGSLYTLFVCLLVPVFLWAALRTWPKTWIGQQILLTPEEDPALVPDEERQTLKQLVGKHGMAKSKMLLGGLIEIEDSRYNAVSDAEPIESGEPICVVRIEGTTIIVRKLNITERTAAATEATETALLEDPFA